MKITGSLSLSLGLIVATLCCFDTADAQTNPVVATPQQLTFNTETGVTTTPQTILLSTASGTANFSVSSYSEAGWLTATSSSTTTPAILTV